MDSLPHLIKISTEPLNTEEIVAVIKDLNHNKAEGLGNILADILKIDTVAVNKLLQPLLLQVWLKESLPFDWKKGVIIKLPNKGDLSQCNNWRD